MSKIVISIVVVLSVLPIALYLIFYPETSTQSPQQSPEKKSITLPTPDPVNPKEGQCAICLQITDQEPKAQCLLNFNCNS